MILFLALFFTLFSTPVFATDVLDISQTDGVSYNGSSCSNCGFGIQFTPTESGNINRFDFMVGNRGSSLGTLTAKLWDDSFSVSYCTIGTVDGSTITSSPDWVTFSNTNSDCGVIASTSYNVSLVTSSSGDLDVTGISDIGFYSPAGETDWGANTSPNFRQYYTDSEPEPTSTPTPTPSTSSNIVFNPTDSITLLFEMFSLTFVALIVYKLIYRIWYEV